MDSYIFTVLFLLAHVHLLGLDGSIAICRRLFCAVWLGAAIEIILFVLHCEICVILLANVVISVMNARVKVETRLILASAGTRQVQALWQTSRVFASSLRAGASGEIQLHIH